MLLDTGSEIPTLFPNLGRSGPVLLKEMSNGTYGHIPIPMTVPYSGPSLAPVGSGQRQTKATKARQTRDVDVATHQDCWRVGRWRSWDMIGLVNC
jgi:hypothetical protein